MIGSDLFKKHDAYNKREMIDGVDGLTYLASSIRAFLSTA
jgi:hypothetical protein